MCTLSSLSVLPEPSVIGSICATGRKAPYSVPASARQCHTRSAAAMTQQGIDLEILRELSSSADAVIADSWGWAKARGCDHAAVVGALMSLEADAMVATEVKQTIYCEPTAEGKEVRAKACIVWCELLSVRDHG